MGRVEKRSLPGFLKVRSGAEGISTGADDLEQSRAQASSSSECATQGERKRPRLDLQESQGDGRRLSSTTTAMTATVASAATTGGGSCQLLSGGTNLGSYKRCNWHYNGICCRSQQTTHGGQCRQCSRCRHNWHRDRSHGIFV